MSMSNDKRDSRSTHFIPDPTIEELDKEGRIDWERKQKGKRQERFDVDAVADELEEQLDDAIRKSKRSKSRKNKRRQLVYDEHQERVIVKRKRRPSRQSAYEWEDE